MCAVSQPLECERKQVVQISLPYLYQLSGALRPLSSIAHDTAISANFLALITAEGELNGFLTQSVYSSTLKATRAPGMTLLAAIKALTEDQNSERTINVYELYYLQNSLQQFETVLFAEMNIGNAFLVTKKRGFDSSDLINQAEVLFPSELLQKVPEAQPDIRQMGRGIAFELGTAAGFHIMRATELVLRHYWDAVTNKQDRPAKFNIGDYLRELDKLPAGEEKTRATLRQIKDLHRNELMHPEVSLSLDEALALLGIAQSAIIAMLREIPAAQPELPGATLLTG